MKTLTLATIKSGISEKAWMGQVVQLARLMGWKRIYHTFNSMRSAYGFPDLVLVRERLLFIECKSETGKLTDDQKGWIEDLQAAHQEVYVLRPSDFDECVRVLGRRG